MQAKTRTSNELLILPPLAWADAPNWDSPSPGADRGTGYFFPGEGPSSACPTQPDQIYLRLTRMMGSELPRAIAAAGRECRPEGKAPISTSMAVKSLDVGSVTFVCI